MLWPLIQPFICPTGLQAEKHRACCCAMSTWSQKSNSRAQSSSTKFLFICTSEVVQCGGAASFSACRLFRSRLLQRLSRACVSIRVFQAWVHVGVKQYIARHRFVACRYNNAPLPPRRRTEKNLTIQLVPQTYDGRFDAVWKADG